MKSRTLLFYLACAWMLSWLAAAALSPMLIGDKAAGTNVTQAFLGPSADHWFGTDKLGRDVFMRVVSGSTVSLGIGCLSVFLALFAGTWLGSLAGYFGRWTDACVCAMIDLFLCFPVFFLILAVVALAGPGVWTLVLVFAMTGWMGTARLVRAQVMSLKEREFVLAARAAGMSPAAILTRHVIPNAWAPVQVSAVAALSQTILTEAGLSFLGLGVQPPIPSWGNLMMDGKASLGMAWWLIFFPGAVIFLTVYSLNIIGEGLSGE